MKSYPLGTEFEKIAKKSSFSFLRQSQHQLLFSVALFFGLSPFVYLPTYYLCKRVRSAAAKIVNTQHVFLIDPLVQSSKLLFLKVNKFNRKLLDGFLFESELSLFGALSQCFLVEKDRNMGKVAHPLFASQSLNPML